MKHITALSLLLIFTVTFAMQLHAQEKKLIPLTNYRRDTLSDTQKDIGQKDLGDVLKSIFTEQHKGPLNNTIGSKPIISFVPAVGYSLQTEFAATLTGNIVFRSTPSSKISSIT